MWSQALTIMETPLAPSTDYEARSIIRFLDCKNKNVTEIHHQSRSVYYVDKDNFVARTTLAHTLLLRLKIGFRSFNGMFGNIRFTFLILPHAIANCFRCKNNILVEDTSRTRMIWNDNGMTLDWKNFCHLT